MEEQFNVHQFKLSSSEIINNGFDEVCKLIYEKSILRQKKN
ncbi:hypothetical protein [Enterococcus sp. AZ196]